MPFVGRKKLNCLTKEVKPLNILMASSSLQPNLPRFAFWNKFGVILGDCKRSQRRLEWTIYILGTLAPGICLRAANASGSVW